MITVQLGTEDQIEAICALDEIARHNNERREFIQRAVAEKICYVAARPQIVGYAVLNYSFFAQGFIAMLCTARLAAAGCWSNTVGAPGEGLPDT